MKTKYLQGGDWADRAFGAGPKGLSPRQFAGWYRERMLEQFHGLDTAAVAKIAGWLKAARGTKRQVFVIGNGGSAATASHAATDLSKTAMSKGKKPLRCMSLTDNNAFITAIGNDLGYERVFSRQLENLLNPKDIVLVITGSGNSPNIVDAVRFAKKRGAKTAALLGFTGGKLKGMVDAAVLVPSTQYGVVEDMHSAVMHILTFYLKQA